MTCIAADEAYQKQILEGVSRTFALTIPQLPPSLYTVVGNAYLLCRIADTIEDDPALSPEQKKHFSQQFIKVIEQKESADIFATALHPLLSSSTSEAEKELISQTARVIRLTHHFDAPQQAALKRCVEIMSEGMMEFQQHHNNTEGLRDMAEMSRYCYYVAGVVGEMLTSLFCHYSKEIDQNREQLEQFSVSFGQALQMTNILKDIWDDQQRGACWLPQAIFKEHGFDISTLTPDKHDPAFARGLEQLIAIAHTHIANSLRYILLIPKKEQGIRRFCLWALGMALLTLKQIHQRLDFTDGQQVKISRRAVKLTIIISNMAAYSDTSLILLFKLMSRNLPCKKDEKFS